MSRIGLAAVATFVALLVVALGASAAKVRTVDWSLAGAADWTPSTAPGKYQVHTFVVHGSIDGVGTYSGTLNAGDYFTTETCGPQCALVTGALTFDTKQGSFTASLDAGSYLYVNVIGSGTYYTMVFDLTVTDGTKSYAHASGQFSLQYSSSLQNDGYFPCDPPPCTVHDAGELTGSFVRGGPG